MTLLELKEKGEAPEWLTEEGLVTLSRGYLQPGENPRQMWERVSRASASALNKPELASKFFDLFWKGWLCGATPVLANMGTDNLPISCYSNEVMDKTVSIFDGYKEIAMMSKYGGGTGSYWGNIRASGTPISKGGKSGGVVPWLKTLEAVVNSTSQGGTRRGAVAAYLPIEHGDVEDFIEIRNPAGDVNRRCLTQSFHHGVTIKDDFMESVVSNNGRERNLFNQLIGARFSFGEPYIMFHDTVNRNKPQMYKDLGLEIKTSNLCSEVLSPTDEHHSFVCCLSSMNLVKYDEWKNTDAVYLAIWFLDGAMTEFISKAKKLEGLENAVRFSEKARTLGLGVLGYHSLVQKRELSFDSFDTMMLNAEIFRNMEFEAKRASKDLALEYGEPEWCKGYGVRNAQLIAVAPTTSNSLIAGGVSQGIEPWAANVFEQKSAKGTFIRTNPELASFLQKRGLDNLQVWEQIRKDKGSLKNVKGLSEQEKSIFLSAREINQFAIVKQASQRQKWIDHGQSLNLFFTTPANVSDVSQRRLLTKYVKDVHIEAWRSGVKSLYYVRGESALNGELIVQDAATCASCEG